MSDKLGKMITNIIEVEKNGVKVVIKQQYNKEINDINIDFSKHDKVFEDKIAELENIINHKLGDWDKHGITYQEILDIQNENKAFRQYIAELESKKNTVEVRVSASPIEIATHLINNTCTINELKMIAEHINVYCNGGK